jgi:hypothetical protein
MSLLDTMMYDLENLPRYRNFSRWFLRISVLVYLFLLYYKRLATMVFTSDYFLLAVTYMILAVILLLAGFMKRSTLTRLTAIAMIILTIIYFAASILLGKDIYQMFLSKVLLIAVLIYFTTSSNWKEYKNRHRSNRIDPADEENVNK